ncbi:MAG: mandelate racemase/muconate lactonizing enzyme family protein [Acidobacteria bacterium]|nr:mandelate racemase/muconate lactonizing enzyme family protein [Acidobacteriota bacterium]
MQRNHRRSFLRSAAGATAAAFWANDTLEAYQQTTNTRSKPSDLRITDMRITAVRAPMYAVMIRIDTNQGISGLGEVRDGASKIYALMLKSRILGENPCNVDKIFRKIKQFGFHARQAGGVCGIEMALWDLAGKAYGVPVYQMLGGKFRDKIRIYCDTTSSNDPKVQGQRLKERREQGYTWLKMDLGYQMVENIPGCVTQPVGQSRRDSFNTQHMFTGIELTDKGVGLMADFAVQVRDIVGWDIPLSTDHYGHIGLNSCIKLGKALEKANISWLEDMIPWQYGDLLKKITDAVNIPVCTGEDIYLKEDFVKLAREHAVDILHPDLATSGGILETKKIGDMIQEEGVPMAMHFAGTPISGMANVHCAAATENFLVLENHSVDTPFWSDLVTGLDHPLVQKGFITVPDKPGLGIELNEVEIKKHLAEPGYFEPTPQWDKDRSNDRLWS